MRECEYLIPALRGREPVTKDRDPFFILRHNPKRAI